MRGSSEWAETINQYDKKWDKKAASRTCTGIEILEPRCHFGVVATLEELLLADAREKTEHKRLLVVGGNSAVATHNLDHLQSSRIYKLKAKKRKGL